MTSCLVSQDEQGQRPEVHTEDTQSITGQSNDMDTRIGGVNVVDVEKAGRKADSVQSIEQRKFYKTEEEKHQFIHESFHLDTNEVLNTNKKLKEAVIKLFLDNFKVLAMNPCQYCETKVLEMKIDQVPGVIPYKS